MNTIVLRVNEAILKSNLQFLSKPIDYDFFRKEAVDEGDILVISIDRLLWTRVCVI